MSHEAHGVQFVHVLPCDSGLESKRNVVFDQRLDASAAASVTALDTGDCFIRIGGGTVERDFGAAGWGLC
ncbi:Uncharacterised protein [uncultured archaeon]|nr:Uncharacterised protein [uncultured archaeon]